MFIVTDYSEQIMREIDASSRIISLQAINLAPPGGYVGQLPQTRVAFDADELADSTIPISGASLLTNLNRIRAGTALGDGIIEVRHLSSGLIIPTIAEISVGGPDGVPLYSGIRTIQFTNADFVEVDSHTILVDIASTLSGFMLTGSGFTSRSWFIEGTVVSGITNPDRLFNLPNGGVTRDYVSVSPSPGTSNAVYTVIYSSDGENWSNLKTVTHPSGTVYHQEYSIDTVPSGALIGIRIDEAPSIPTGTPFTDFTVILNTRELGGAGGGTGTLPEFTPKRVPFADNTTGILTESTKFNYLTSGDSNILAVGTEEYTGLGAIDDKVAIYLVRDNVDGGLLLETYSDATYAPSIIGYRSRGTQASPEAILQEDVLFRFTGRGRAPGGWGAVPSFSIRGVADEDWTDTAYGTRGIISITKVGEDFTTDMFVVDSDGLTIAGDVIGENVSCATFKMTTSPTIGHVLTAIDLLGNAEWRPTSASGIVMRDKYDPDVSNSASSFNDEFSDDSLDPKWTVLSYDGSFDLNQAANGSRHLSESLRHGYLTLQGDWGIRTGIYQSFAPTDDSWTLVCKLTAGYVPESDDSYFNFGITTSGNTALYEARVGYYGFNGIRVIYDDGGGALEATNKGLPITGPVYISIVKKYVNPDTFYSIYMSHDGFSWLPIDLSRQFTNLTTATLYAQYFGVENQIIDGISSVDFVRYFGGLPHTFQIGSNP